MTLQTALIDGRRLLTFCTLAFLFSACAHTKVVDNWKTDQPVGHKPDKVAVIAVLPDALTRKAVEIDIAKVLVAKGTPAVAGSLVPGMSGGIRGEIDVDAATEILRSADVDGIVVMFYSGGGRDQNYVRSDYWAEYAGSGVAYGWGRPYFTNVYVVHQGANITEFTTSAWVESSYYDLETEQPIWRVVTETKDVEHSDAADDIAHKVASEMRSAGLN
jgi:hypothetical protein